MTSKTSKPIPKRFKYIEPIKITEPYNPEVITFENTDEFENTPPTTEIELIKDYYGGVKGNGTNAELESRIETVERQLKEVFAEILNIQKYLSEN